LVNDVKGELPDVAVVLLLNEKRRDESFRRAAGSAVRKRLRRPLGLLPEVTS
jgi:hypothetical protein